MSDSGPRSATEDDFLHKRDENRDLVPVTETVELHAGEEVTVKVIPVTKGHLNRYDAMEADFDALDDEALQTLLGEHYRTPDFRDEDGEVPMQTVKDLDATEISALVDGILKASNLEDVAADAETLVGAEGNERRVEVDPPSEQSSKHG